MAEIARLEAQVEIKSSAEKFYGFFRNNMHHLVQMFPKNIKSFQLLDGDDIRAGSLTHWKYDLGEILYLVIIFRSLVQNLNWER